MSCGAPSAGLDELDARILEAVQGGLPLEAQPFLAVARQLNAREEDVVHRLRRLHQIGIVRRVGAVLDSQALGYSSALVGCAVDENRIEEVAQLINRLPNVTHNYRRESSESDIPFNLWFTLSARSQEELGELAEKLKPMTGSPMVVLRSLERFKLEARFSPLQDE